ncbi:unnamed protein product [Caenorhabditis auriculariae]|uniref:Ground-like domain-containing protein n=1 Tax=Caenorhabditis auriculariae TaxID=2777116 RepID=A0A8S1HB28_9PELO|nr:unnamed protein product [Caenorhabditis auriculariae]
MHNLTILSLVFLFSAASALFFGGGGGCCPMPMQSCGGCGRKKRSVEERQLEFPGIVSKDGDMLCNTPELKQLMIESMKDNAVDSSKALQWSLERHDLQRYVVVCSENPFVYTVRSETAYCGSRKENHYCHAFAL